MFVINVNAFFGMAYKFFAKLISEDIKEKIIILQDDFTKLTEILGQEDVE